MSAFKDSGHHWWQQCPACGMAWGIGEAPSDPDEEVECKRCLGEDEDNRAAEARGFARAREQAASVADAYAQTCEAARDGRSDGADEVAERIRAMEDGGAPDVAATFTLEEVVGIVHDAYTPWVSRGDVEASVRSALLALRKVTP